MPGKKKSKSQIPRDGEVTPVMFRNKGRLYEMAARKAVSNVYTRYPKDPDIDVVLALARLHLASLQNKPVRNNGLGRKRHSILGTVCVARGKS